MTRALVTRREGEIIRLVAAGLSNKEIGRILTIKESSVRNMLTILYRKIRATNRAHAMLILMVSGYLNLEEIGCLVYSHYSADEYNEIVRVSPVPCPG